jgi:hypothetical protein
MMEETSGPFAQNLLGFPCVFIAVFFFIFWFVLLAIFQ